MALRVCDTAAPKRLVKMAMNGHRVAKARAEGLALSQRAVVVLLAPKARTQLIADIGRDGRAHPRYLAEDGRLGHWMGEDGRG